MFKSAQIFLVRFQILNLSFNKQVFVTLLKLLHKLDIHYEKLGGYWRIFVILSLISSEFGVGVWNCNNGPVHH